jgi:hypothetical protein
MNLTKTEINERLEETRHGLAATVNAMSANQFQHAVAGWSADGYLKHLLLSVKPFVRVLEMGPAAVHQLFGTPEQSTRTYDDFVQVYQSRLAEGVRAESYDNVVPDSYRMPEGITDAQQHLVQTWHESHDRLTAALQQWTEDDLNQHQLPHPAIGLITVREMLYFTVHHNKLHWQDIHQLSS